MVSLSLWCLFTIHSESPSLGTTWPPWHRRRIKTEEKAKVVATAWGTEWIQFLDAIAILHQDELKKGMNSSYSSYRSGAIHPIRHIFLVQFIQFFQSSWCKIASAARNWINYFPQTAVTTFAFSSVFILLLWHLAIPDSIFLSMWCVRDMVDSVLACIP